MPDLSYRQGQFPIPGPVASCPHPIAHADWCRTMIPVNLWPESAPGLSGPRRNRCLRLMHAPPTPFQLRTEKADEAY